MNGGIPLMLVVIGAAAVAAINPTSIGIMNQVIASTFGRGKDVSRLVWVSVLFLVSMFAASTLFGLAFLYVIRDFSDDVFHGFALTVAALANVFALLDIKDFFWYGKGLSLSASSNIAVKIHRKSKRLDSAMKIINLGLLSSVAVAPASIAALLAVVVITAAASASALYIPLFCGIFLLPLISIIIMAINGTRVSVITKWKEESKGTMRLYTGLVIVALSWVILLIESGAVKFR